MGAAGGVTLGQQPAGWERLPPQPAIHHLPRPSSVQTHTSIHTCALALPQYIYYTSLQRRRERMQASRRHRHHHHHHHHRRRHDSTGMQQHQSGSGEQQPGGSAEQAWAGSGGDREGRGPHAAADGRDAAASVAASAAAAHECCDSSGEIKPGGVLLGGSSSRAVPAADVSFRPQRVLACLGTLLVVAHLQQPQPDEAGQRGLGGRRLLAAGVLAAGSGGTGLLAHMPLWA